MSIQFHPVTSGAIPIPSVFYMLVVELAQSMESTDANCSEQQIARTMDLLKNSIIRSNQNVNGMIHLSKLNKALVISRKTRLETLLQERLWLSVNRHA